MVVLHQRAHCNDTIGHPAGDALLTRFGVALRGTLGDAGDAYRLGGDEFCVLVDTTGKAAEAIRRKAMWALSDRGSGFVVTASCGSVEVPIQAADTAQTLKVAAERLYAQKASRRTDAGLTLARDVLLQAIRECEPQTSERVSRGLPQWVVRDGLFAWARPLRVADRGAGRRGA